MQSNITELQNRPITGPTQEIIQQVNDTESAEKINQLFIDLQRLKQIISSHGESINQLNSKSQVHDYDIDSLKKLLNDKIVDYDGYNKQNDSNITEINEKINNLRQEILNIGTKLDLMSSFQPSEGNDVDGHQLQIILQEIAKIRKELDNYVLKTEFEKEVSPIKLKINNIQTIVTHCERVCKDTLAKLEMKFDHIDGKQCQDDIQELRDLIAKLQRIKPTITEKVIASDNSGINEVLNDLMAKIEQISNEQKSQKQSHNQFVQITNQKFVDLEKKLASLQIDQILSELQSIRESMESIRQLATNADKKVKELKKQMELFVKKDDMVIYVTEAIGKLRDEILILLKRIDDALNLKADQEDLMRLEQQILAKLEEIVQALMKQFANKQETKKALIYLEQKVNQLFLLLDGGEKDGDGLIVKKPWSCISCDKELEKFKGQLGEYRGWQVFPPKETSPDRLGKFGVGYKIMQEKQKIQRTEVEKGREIRTISHTNQQFYQQDQLPKVTK